MAGLGRKVFNAGEVLSAANVQGYLQDQVVQVYSGTAARSSALGTAVSEGMMSYLTDSNELSVYTSNGTAAWSPVSLQQSGNAVINGAFDIWQRGDSFSNPGFLAFTADRWRVAMDAVPTTHVVSKQTFTPGTAPVAGYEGQYFYRSLITTVGTNTIMQHITRLEDVRTFAGQVVTLSFWAKADSARSFQYDVRQGFGTGGSSEASSFSGTVTLSTSWTRYSVSGTVASVAGKTIGAGSYLFMNLTQASASGSQLDLWGVQLEAGSVATPFRRSSPTIAAEEMACLRYCQKINFGERAVSMSGSNVAFTIPFLDRMRVNPTVTLSMTNANYGSGWVFVNMGVAALTKSGTVSILPTVTTKDAVSVYATGATWSGTPNGIQDLGFGNLIAEAEL